MKLRYLLTGTQTSKPYLFGVEIFEQDWLYLGKEVAIYDHKLKKTVHVSLYQLKIKHDYYSFGAICLNEETKETRFYQFLSD